MVFVFVGLAALAVIVVALVAVGGVVGRLRVEPSRSVFEPDEELEFVAEALPGHLTADLSYEQVQRVLRLHLDHLHEQGVARSGGDLDVAPGVKVLEPEDAVEAVLARAALVSFFPKRAAVAAIITAQLAYFEAIGAVRPVEGPDLEALDGLEGLDGLAG